ncbi:MAG: hypothetical protein ACK5NY_10950 [Burkholderiaceae bacterium]|jgi:hypothetical protein
MKRDNTTQVAAAMSISELDRWLQIWSASDQPDHSLWDSDCNLKSWVWLSYAPEALESIFEIAGLLSLGQHLRQLSAEEWRHLAAGKPIDVWRWCLKYLQTRTVDDASTAAEPMPNKTGLTDFDALQWTPADLRHQAMSQLMGLLKTKYPLTHARFSTVYASLNMLPPTTIPTSRNTLQLTESDWQAVVEHCKTMDSTC